MNALMIELREDVLRNLRVDWVTFEYNWRDDFAYNYFTDYFYHRNQCLSSIQNSAHTLVNIFTYVCRREAMPVDFDIVVIMNRYVYLYVKEMLEEDSLVIGKIQELYRRHGVSKILPLLVNRHVPMVIYPIVRSYLQEGY